jgi:chromosome segregation ATPase
MSTVFIHTHFGRMTLIFAHASTPTAPELIPERATTGRMASTPDEQTVERRLAAVERAVDLGSQSESDHLTKTDASQESLKEQVTELERRVEELEAAVQAVRGFLGGIDAVNEEVESRANTAVATVERLERRLDREAAEGEHDAGRSTSAPRSTGDDSGEDEQAEPTADEPADRTLRERLREQW